MVFTCEYYTVIFRCHNIVLTCHIVIIYYMDITDFTICYSVATISRLLTIIGLFCKRALHKRPILSKETYNFKEPTNRSHPISGYHIFTESHMSIIFRCEYI